MFPELETLTELLEAPKLPVVAGYADGVPCVAGGHLCKSMSGFDDTTKGC